VTPPVEEPWFPDPHLIDSALAGNLSNRTLSGPDRAWVVAGLAARGITAEATADLLGCSLRTIRAVRAEPMTRVCTHALNLVIALDDALTRHKAAHRAWQFELEDVRATADRYRGQRDELIAGIADGTVTVCRRGHPLTPYNTYRRADGRRRCRECDRTRQSKYRRTAGTTSQVEGTNT
jgi:hypothetical protein